MKKRLCLWLLIVSMLLPTLAGCVGEEPAPSTGLGETGENVVKLENPTAFVSFGDSGITGVAAREPEDLVTVGTSEKKNVSVLVGDNDSTYSVRTLKGYGSEMTFTISGLTPNKSAMIDIEEIHLREDQALSYEVYINDQRCFGRTYEPIADGPNHAFFDIPASLVGDSGSITLRLVNCSDSEVRFCRVWAISDPEEKAQQQGIARKMDVVLMLNQTPDNLNLAYLQSLVDSYRCQGMYNIGLCWEIQYLQWGKERTEQYLNNVILASVQTGATLYLGINSWWAGTPSGMDGLGGMWQDVAYQQITYAVKNQNDRGQWQLSSPNEWGNTPWLSMNNPYYNQVRVQRIQETVQFLQLRTAELVLAGRDLPAIHLYTENEPYYWPINWTRFDFNNYPDGVGDFSPWVIEAAAKDGITLDPTDGLTEQEAFWMYRNLNTYISEVGSAMADGLGYNYITVKDGVVSYPTEQMVEDSYSHTPIQYIYPNWDESQRAWENHVLDSIHFGGEWSVFQDQDNVRALDYLIAYGSFSNINAERAGFPGGNSSKDFRVLSQCYAYGLEGVIIYNVLADSDQQNVIGESFKEDQPMEVRLYHAAPIFESDFSKRTAYGVNNTLVAIGGFRWDRTALIPNAEDGGSLTYRIRNAADFTSGLEVAVEGSFGAEGGKLEILAGPSQENLKSVGIFDSADQTVTVDPSFYSGGEDAYIQIKVCGKGLTSAQLASLSLTKVGIYRPGIQVGCADGSVYTYGENRIRCQIIAARADAERLLNDYITRAGGELTTENEKNHFAKAYNLYAQGNYGEAFQSISQSISQLLPATFTVSGYGRLGEYPLEIDVDSDVKVTVCLREVSENTLRFTLSASDKTKLTVSLLTDSGCWSLRQEGEEYILTAGDTPAKNGKVSFDLELAARKSKEYPAEFEARLLSTDPTTIRVQSQDSQVTDYCNHKDFQVAGDAKIFRGADGEAKEEMQACNISALKNGDYVQVKLNDQGRVEEIYAWYGEITGKVVKMEEMSVRGTLSNAFVTVESADGKTLRLEIGYDAKLHFTGATGETGKLALVQSIGLQYGQEITVTYCPYEVNGRIRIIEITD